MRKNFVVGQSNELIVRGRVVDLHNMYDLRAIEVHGQSAVRMSFSPNAEFGKGQPPVMLVFERILFLDLGLVVGAGCGTLVEEVGYMKQDQVDDSWLLEEKQAESEDHIFFRLDCGHIRIGAGQGTAYVGES